MTNAKPAHTIKDGLISVSIWQNTAEDGTNRYCVTFNRSYFKNETWHTAYSFSRGEILRIARLAEHAYDWIADQIVEDRLNAA